MIKQSEEPESIRAGKRSEGEYRLEWEIEFPELENISELGAYPLEVESCPLSEGPLLEEATTLELGAHSLEIENHPSWEPTKGKEEEKREMGTDKQCGLVRVDAFK